MSEDLLLSLKSWPSSDTKDSLPLLISRINEQRGSFRDVTEENLIEEARAAEAGESIVDEQSTGETVETGQDAKSQNEQLAAARLDILKQVALAQTESAMTLDLISLLLSKHTPVQAQLTLSPYIKQNLPIASLGAETMQVPQLSDEDKRDDEMVSIGWKMQSLGNTADSLLKSATRLEQEMELEAKYWEQVLAIKEEGWSLCRLPREKHTLGVRYGFAEAYSEFRDRGLVALRRDEKGNVQPDRGVRSRSRKLQVQLLNSGVPIAMDERVDVANTDNMPIAKLLLQARNSIFDEELHHELNREARNLVNQGVRCVGDAVILPYEGEKLIEIDLVSLGDTNPAVSHLEFSSSSRKIAQGDDIVLKSVAISLRILLSHAHRQRLMQRSQPPPPIRGTNPPRPIYPIIKPILEILRHRSDVRAARTFLEHLEKHLSAATLNFNMEHFKTSPDLASLPSPATSATTSATEALANFLTASPHTSIVIHLPSNLTALKVEFHTSFVPPTMGTVYQATILSYPPASSLANLPQNIQFPSLSALEEHILHLLMLDIISLISANPATGSGWITISPYDGQLVRKNRERTVGQTFTIVVEKERLSLECRTVGRGTDHLRTVRWGEGEEEGYEKKGLLKVIEDALEGK